MRVFITSDYHLQHLNIIEYAKRPFVKNKLGLMECENLIKKNYNEIVQENDFVIFLGDLSCSRNPDKIYIKNYIRSLNGRKILIKGNHDNLPDEFYFSLFEEIYECLILDNIMISHYPCYLDDQTKNEGLEHYHIFKNSEIPIIKIYHGHIHDKDANNIALDNVQRINCSIDFKPNNYKPVEIFDGKIISFIEENF